MIFCYIIMDPENSDAEHAINEDKPGLVKIIDGTVMYYCHKCRSGMPRSKWKNISQNHIIRKVTQINPIIFIIFFL